MHKTIALAGVFQSAILVKQLAWNGKITEKQLETSINSLFKINADSVEDVYGGDINNLRLGLETIIKLFQNSTKSNKDHEVARYALSMLHLEKLLMKNNEMLNIIHKGLERAKNQATHFSSTHENVIANLAGIYSDTLSTFKFRIHVAGNRTYLANQNSTNKIRSLLLAGVRSAVLWRQLGGSRWQFIFNKKTIIKEAKHLLSKISEPELID